MGSAAIRTRTPRVVTYLVWALLFVLAIGQPAAKGPSLPIENVAPMLAHVCVLHDCVAVVGFVCVHHASSNDVWLTVDFHDQKLEEDVVAYVHRLLGRRYKPLQGAKVTIHCSRDAAA